MGFPVFVMGRGMLDSDVLAVERVVSEYDERLYFDRNPDTGQWCVYLKTLPSEPDIPLWGDDRIPHPDDVLKRLVQADSLRQGEQILDDMRKRNEKALDPLRAKADDASGQLAEGMELLHRKMGSHPSPRIFVPS